jgi:hypothetical protein
MSLIYPPAHLVYVINLKILLHRRLRRNYEFEASLSYVVRPCLKKKKKNLATFQSCELDFCTGISPEMGHTGYSKFI